MVEIIKISENERGDQAVSARELHQFLEVGRDFSNWIKDRISKYGFIEGEDFYKSYFTKDGVEIQLAKSGELGDLKSYRIEYVITLDMAKQLSMVENNEKGNLARRYFIECEKQLKEVRANKNELREPSEKEIKIKLMEAEAKLLAEKRLTLEMVTNQVHKEILFSKFYSDEKYLLPLPEVSEKSYSATELSKLILKKYGLNLSANKIGRIANEHNLKKPEFGVFLYDKSKYSDKTVESFHYYEKCVDEVVRLFRLENKKNSKKQKQEFNDSIHF